MKKLLSRVAALMLIAVIAVPVLASPATATRTLPASVAPGAEFDVTIEASGCGAFGQVEETLPEGFTYLSCTPSDIGVQQIGNMLKFTFLGDATSFTYSVVAPVIDSSTTYTLHGVVEDEDRISYPIEDDEITVGTDWNGWDNDGFITNEEILEAVYYWLTDTTHNGHVLTNDDILLLVYMWLTA